MSSKSVAISENDYIKWIYGPQVSTKNAIYAVGGGGANDSAWYKAYTNKSEKNIKNKERLYGKQITPENIIKLIEDTQQTTNTILSELKLVERLNNCNSILDVLILHSVFINALGLLVQKNSDKLEPDVFMIKLKELYEELYKNTYKILKKSENIELFVNPEIFLELTNIRMTNRPKNLIALHSQNGVSLADTLEKVMFKYPLNTPNATILNHYIPTTMRKCSNDTIAPFCAEPFANITNPHFKIIADVLKCYCTILTMKISRVIGLQTITIHDINKKEISNGDYLYTQNLFNNRVYLLQNPIIIRHEPGTYLSQLFERIRIDLYKPLIIKPTVVSYENIKHAAKMNIIMNSVGYSYLDKFKFFTRTIGSDRLDIPVHTIYKDSSSGLEYIKKDQSIELSTAIFKTVINELFELEVFKPMSNMPDRYELNTEFKIETLACFNNLPNNDVKNSMKESITKSFYGFVGNLMIFALVNNLKLPKKISRFYLIYLFRLITFKKEKETVQNKMILCSIYLNEKAPRSFIDNVLKLMNNPESAKSIKMNSALRIVEGNEPIYSSNPEIFTINLIDYIYNNAYKDYMDGIKATNVPLMSSQYAINKNLGYYLEGFNSIQAVQENEHDMGITMQEDILDKIPKKNHTPELFITILRKLDECVHVLLFRQ